MSVGPECVTLPGKPRYDHSMSETIRVQRIASFDPAKLSQARGADERKRGAGHPRPTPRVSQSELEARTGINRSVISAIENGRVPVGATMLRQLAKGLGVHPGELCSPPADPTLRDLRDVQAMTSVDVATATGMTPSKLFVLERGGVAKLKPGDRKALAQALAVNEAQVDAAYAASRQRRG